MTATITPSVPAVGSVAPDFTVNSTSGSPVTLSQFRGTQPVLLAFFPLAFTSVCTVEVCSFSEDYDKFAERGVVVFPISVDSVPTLREYKAKHALKIDFLSDFKRDVSRAYGVLNETKFHSERAYFLIDRDGIIRWAHVEEHTRLRRDDAEILAHIDALTTV